MTTPDSLPKKDTMTVDPLPNQTDYSTIDRPTFGGDPIKFLVAFHAMRRDPQRQLIGFDHVDLQWLADVWKEVAIVSRGNIRFTVWAERYQKLCDDLKQGLFENGGDGVGICLFEHNDWPSRRTIEEAARTLDGAEIRGIH